MSEDNLDHDLDSLIGQLKDTTTVNNHVQRQEPDALSKEEIEDFVVENSGKLIRESIDAIDTVKDHIMASGDPDSISALSELIRASSGAIESLNKLVVQNKRSATTLTVKQMDVQSKYAIEDNKNENALVGTREDIFKKMLAEAKVIDVADEDTESSSDPQTPDQL